MSSAQPDSVGIRSFIVGATALNDKYLRVKLSSGLLVVAGITDHDEVGILRLGNNAIGASAAVVTPSAPGTRSGIASEAIAVGDIIYTAAAGKLSATAGNGAIRRGIALTAAGADGEVFEYQPEYPRAQKLKDNPITDPGDAGAVPVNLGDGYVLLVTAGAEVRSIAAPAYVGQRLLLSMDTDGGDCVVTVAATVNQTGNNTLTFADVDDTIELVGRADNKWSVGFNDGVALSTV